jgi:hypothetical protein
MSAIIQASPLEKLSQEPLPTGDSCVLIIFGASGDLTKRKLIPGLYNLACEGCMNPQFEVRPRFFENESFTPTTWRDYASSARLLSLAAFRSRLNSGLGGTTANTAGF